MEERVWHQFYDDGVPASIDFEDLPVPRFLELSAAEYGDAIDRKSTRLNSSH